MEIKSLSLLHFRNYTQLHTTFSPSINIIYGENAQGKTNLLEGAAYLSNAKSHRTRGDKELIQFGTSFAEVKGEILSRDRLFTVHINLSTNARRRIEINQAGA